MNVIIGVDPHKATHHAFAVDDHEEELAELSVRAARTQTQRLLACAEPFSARSRAPTGSATCYRNSSSPPPSPTAKLLRKWDGDATCRRLTTHATCHARKILTGMVALVARYGNWIACCLSRGSAAPLNRSDIAQLAADMGEQRVAGGTFVFRRGDHAARVHVVRTGSIELSKVVNGRRVTLQRLRPGDVFGDVPAILGDEEPFDARAVDDSSVLSIEASTLFELLQTRPGVAKRWFVSMAERMAGLQNRIDDLLAGSLDSQLASLLLREAGSTGEVRITQSHLAELLGVRRSSVQRVLKSLESAELIELHYRRIEIVNRFELGELLEKDPS